jgi:hypothetical protein
MDKNSKNNRKMQKILIIFIIVTLQGSNLYSNKLSNDWIEFREDYRQLFRNVSNSKFKDLAAPTTIVLSSLLAAQLDEEVRNIFKSIDDENFNKFQIVANQLGEPVSFCVFPGIVYSAGYLFNSNSMRKTGRLLYESVLLNGILTAILKTSIGRARPYVESGNSRFEHFTYNDDSFMSMPSGHTSMVFAMATILSYRSKSSFLPIIYYAMAGSTGMARIYFDKHWFSDVLAGAMIGTASSLLIINAEKSRKYIVNRTEIPIIQFKIDIDRIKF